MLKLNLQLFASAANQTVHSGQTVRLKIAGKEVGRIQSGNGNRSFGQQGVYQLGSIMPQEHVATQYQGGFTVDAFYLRKSSLAELGLLAYGEEILTMDVIDIEVTDNVTNKTVIVYEGCSLDSCSETFSVGAISGQNASWVYLNARRG